MKRRTLVALLIFCASAIVVAQGEDENFADALLENALSSGGLILNLDVGVELPTICTSKEAKRLYVALEGAELWRGRCKIW